MKLTVIVALFLSGCDRSVPKHVEESSPRVITPLGIIEGVYDTSEEGRRYGAYKGIPFAHPPIGESRFGVAKRISPWSGVLMAKLFGPDCMQYNFAESDPSARVLGSEDCLYLNVYTPMSDIDSSGGDLNGTRTRLLPVIFYIPGGAFEVGNGYQYGPKYLLDRNVLLVTIN